MIGRLQLSTERSQQEDNQSIVQLRILRTQEAIIKIMKMRKKMNNAALQVCVPLTPFRHSNCYIFDLTFIIVYVCLPFTGGID